MEIERLVDRASLRCRRAGHRAVPEAIAIRDVDLPKMDERPPVPIPSRFGTRLLEFRLGPVSFGVTTDRKIDSNQRFISEWDIDPNPVCRPDQRSSSESWSPTRAASITTGSAHVTRHAAAS